MGFALNARLIDFGEHSHQQLFGRSRADAGSLQIQNFSALPGDCRRRCWISARMNSKSIRPLLVRLYEQRTS
jgi:hypothetical protein